MEEEISYQFVAYLVKQVANFTPECSLKPSFCFSCSHNNKADDETILAVVGWMMMKASKEKHPFAVSERYRLCRNNILRDSSERKVLPRERKHRGGRGVR